MNPHDRPHVMEYRRICRHSIQGFAGTPNQGKRTTARGICHRRAQWFGLLRGLSCEGNGRGMCDNEVCFDELGGVIDRAIESGTDKAKYDKFCEQERQNLYVTVVTV